MLGVISWIENHSGISCYPAFAGIAGTINRDLNRVRIALHLELIVCPLEWRLAVDFSSFLFTSRVTEGTPQSISAF
jgi:hypothetical protein